MRSIIGVISPTTTTLRLLFGQAQDSVILPSSFMVLLGTTSSLVYVPIFTATYTIDISGIISVVNMFFDIITYNDLNAVSKLQVSGDGGTTFVDVTGDIGSTFGLETGGSGLWLNTIQVGTNKYQIRMLGKSTDGNPANIIADTASKHLLKINKKLI